MKFIRLLKHELAAEAEDWSKKGLISEDQARSILKLYGTDLPDGKGKSLAYFVLLALAGLFMGVGAILLISHNWEDIPRGIRMISLIMLTLGANGAGLYYYSQGKTRASQIWFLLGSLLYGASIFLIAQIYHLGEYFPNGVLYWVLGVLPLALILESTLLMLLGVVLSAVWFFLEAGFGYIPWLFLAFCASFFWFSLKQKQSILVFLAGVVGMVTFCEILLTRILSPGLEILEPSANHVYFTLGIFLLLFTLGGFLERRQISNMLTDYGLVLRLWAMRFGVLTLFIFSFSEPWEELFESRIADFGFVAFWSLGVLVLVYTLLHACSRLNDRESAVCTPVLSTDNIPSIAFVCAFALANMLIGLTGASENLIVPFQIITNLGLLSMGIWCITRALRTSAGSSFYFGVGIILITALLRYFDLIGDYIGGAILFFIAGGIMFLSAKLWNKYSSLERTAQ